jgi:hypothetical protein
LLKELTVWERSAKMRNRTNFEFDEGDIVEETAVFFLAVVYANVVYVTSPERQS